MVDVIEVFFGIDASAVDARLEMKMLSGSTACAPRQCNDLSCRDLVTDTYQVLGVMAIVGLQAVSVLNADEVAIAGIESGENHLAVEGCQDVVVGLGLEVCS